MRSTEDFHLRSHEMKFFVRSLKEQHSILDRFNEEKNFWRSFREIKKNFYNISFENLSSIKDFMKKFLFSKTFERSFEDLSKPSEDLLKKFMANISGST